MKSEVIKRHVFAAGDYVDLRVAGRGATQTWYVVRVRPTGQEWIKLKKAEAEARYEALISE